MKSRPKLSDMPELSGDFARPADAARVAAIILSWGGVEHTQACLSSLEQLTIPLAHTIVVDNAPSDTSARALRQEFPDVILLQNRENAGYTGGNNQGIHWATKQGVDHFFILNNDVTLRRDSLASLLAIAEVDPRIGAVGPKVLYRDSPDRIQSAGGKVTWHSRLTSLIGEGELDRGQHDRIQDVDFLAGCALLIKRETVEAVGHFDPDFFIYYEDADLGVRIREAGFRLVYVPHAYAFHVGSAEAANSSAFRAYYNHRNALLFARKHAPWPRRWLIYLASLRMAGKQCLRAITPTRRREAIAALRGTCDFYLGRFGRRSYGSSAISGSAG